MILSFYKDININYKDASADIDKELCQKTDKHPLHSLNKAFLTDKVFILYAELTNSCTTSTNFATLTGFLKKLN